MEVKTFRNILLSLMLLLPSLGMAQDYGSGSPQVMISPAAAGGTGTNFLDDANCEGVWLILDDTTGTETDAETNRCTAGSGSGLDPMVAQDAFALGTGSPVVPVGTAAGQGSVSFDGGNDEYSLADNADYESTSWTTACWIYHEASANDAIIGKGTDNWYMRVNTANSLRALNNTSALEDSAGSLVAVNDWTFVAARYDAAVDTAQPWINGQQVCNGACDPGSDLTGNSTAIQIGERGGSNDFTGDMRACGYWSRALTDDEMEELFLCGVDGLADGSARDDEYGGATCTDIDDICC